MPFEVYTLKVLGLVHETHLRSIFEIMKPLHKERQDLMDEDLNKERDSYLKGEQVLKKTISPLKPN